MDSCSVCVEDIKRLLQADAWEKTIVCPPETERKLIDGLSGDEFHGKFKIITSSLVPEGKVYVIDDARIEKAWQELNDRYPVGWFS